MRSLLALLFCFLTGCSLIALDGVELADCAEDPVRCSCIRDGDCARFDDADDLCARYACGSEGSCERVARDEDGDGHQSTSCGGDDCDDRDPAVFTGARELCDGRDTDCNGLLNAPNEDADSDGRAGACAGEATRDCDDRDALTFWDAPERCDGLDNDCLIDGARRRSDGPTREPDEDADDDGAIALAASCEGGKARDDCDDRNAQVHPLSPELCDGIDTNCDGRLNGPDEDDDRDDSPDVCANVTPFDCDDMDPDTHPFARELCDLRDNDCSEPSAPGQPLSRLEPAEDRDGDGHVSLSAPCEEGEKTDCDDGDDTVYTGAFESCDGQDNDCDGVRDNIPDGVHVGSACLPTAVSAGAQHTCVVERDRSVVCWGAPAIVQPAGARRDGSTLAAMVIPGIDDAVELVSGDDFSCARDSRGDVGCWGRCSITRALTGLDSDSLDPNDQRCREGLEARVVSNATQVTAGLRHACALREDGSVWCWGEVCRFDTPVFLSWATSCIYSVAPVEVVGARGMRRIASGGLATCGLYDDGSVACFRFDGTPEARVEAFAMPSAQALGCAGWECCALHGDGQVTCFEPLWLHHLSCAAEGCDKTRKMVSQAAPAGAQSIVSSGSTLQAYLALPEAPVAIPDEPEPPPVFSEPTHLLRWQSTGDTHCFLDALGRVSCIGQQYVLNGGSEQPAEPAHVGELGAVAGLSLGQSHGCAVTDGGLECWGQGFSGQLGDGRTDGTVLSVPKRVSVIAQALATQAGEHTTCSLLPDRSLRCVKPGTTFDVTATNVLAFDLEGDTMPGRFSRRYEMLCVLDLAGKARCRGDLSMSYRERGAQLERSDLQAVVASSQQLVALTEDGHVFSAPLVALDTQPSREVALPSAILTAVVDGDESPLHEVREVDCGAIHCCARTESAVWCWGGNDEGQLGSRPLNGTAKARRVPLPSTSAPIDLSVHADRSCAVVAGAGVYCWGERLPSDLSGDGGPVVERTERTSDAEAVALGGVHACARLRSGQVRCWGLNDRGSLGVYVEANQSRLPLNVEGIPDARDLGCGAEHCCATRTSGQTVCWGSDAGQLGSAVTPQDAFVPSPTVDLFLRLDGP